MNSETKHIVMVMGELAPPVNALRPTELGTIKDIWTMPFHIKVALAHKMLYAIDKDWPYMLDDSDSTYFTPGYCEKCGGLEYVNPILSPKIINDVIGAVGLKIDIMIMVSANNCEAAKKTFLDIKLSNELPHEIEGRQTGYLLATRKYSNLDTIAGFTELLDECPSDLEFWDTVGVVGTNHYKPVYKTEQN